MSRTFRWVVSVGLAVAVIAGICFLAQTGIARESKKESEQEKDVSLRQVPAKVKATILKAAGKNKIEEIEKITRVIYEAEWTIDGQEIEVCVSRKGKLLGIEVEGAEDEDGDDDDEDGYFEGKEVEMTLDDVPAAVRAKILQVAGKNKIEEVEQVTQTLYEAEWEVEGGEVEILIAPNGRLLKKEFEKDDDDDDDGHEHAHHGEHDGHDHGDHDGHDHGDHEGHEHGDHEGHEHGDHDGDD